LFEVEFQTRLILYVVVDRYQHSLPVEGQILEDLSLDANALCTLRVSPPSSVAGYLPSNADVRSAASRTVVQADSPPAALEGEVETLAVAQLRGLEQHAKQVCDARC
jgi:hypothetical protein